MKTDARFMSTVASAALLGSALTSLLAPMQGTITAQRIPILTPEQEEILSHQSIVYLDDGQGGQVKTLRLSDINFQVVNGMGSTQTSNGVGNLIVGYNETGNPNGDKRTGSHNIVGGLENSFSSWGGLVVGQDNTISAPWASVSGGGGNTASEQGASVSGGANRTAPGADDWVAGSLFEDN